MRKLHVFLLVYTVAVLIWSAIAPHDYFTWVLEVFPGVFGMVFLLAFYEKFRFTDIAYILIALHCTILFAGGKWTYAENVWFEWIKEAMNLDRNYYDRLGHFMQGFVPALIAREILERRNVAKSFGWLVFTVISFCLAVSAFYELIEFVTAKILGSTADEFLGSQGDIWDAQWDMTMALIGSVTYFLTIGWYHGKRIRAIMK